MAMHRAQGFGKSLSFVLVLHFFTVAHAAPQTTPPSAPTSEMPAPADTVTPPPPAPIPAVSAGGVALPVDTSPPPLAPGVPNPPPVVVPASPNPPPAATPAAPSPLKPSLELSGFVAAQVTFDSNDAVKQNHLISVDGQGNIGRFGWAFDATRLNLVGQLHAGGFQLEGRAEVDMESPIYFRIRHVYASMTKRGTTLLLGQTDTLIGNQVGPNNFNNDWLFAQGNAYDRLPQLRVSHDTGRLFVAAALLPNVHNASDVIPHAQARLLVRFGQGRGMIGAAGHFGYSNHVKNPNPSDPNAEVGGVISYLASLDSGIAAGPVAISAQVWIGAGAAHGTGGHFIGNPLFVVNASGEPVSVPAAGGFLDIYVKLRSRLSFGAAGGVSILTDTAPGGVPVPMTSNSTAVLYAAFALRPNWVFAFEAQGARTERSLDNTAPYLRTALYNGRLLFGQRFSF